MKLLTPEQTAEALAVSRSTVMRIITKPVVPAVCCGEGGVVEKILTDQEDILPGSWVINREKNGNGKA